MSPVGIFSGLLFLLALYCATDPFKHGAVSNFPEFESVKVDLCPWSELPPEKDGENLLQKSEIKFQDQVQGPESLAFDPLGRGPYTGVADGRILFWDGESWTDFAYTSPNRSSLCDLKPSILSYLKNEHICGRPLGLRFNKKTGDLYIADAYLGLMKVGPEGGLATSLATEAEGQPLKFTNDLDIDDQGNVYFTDSSSKYQRRNFIQLVFSAEKSGRLLRYNPVTGESIVLVRNLQFPNGVSMSKDGAFVVFSEGSTGRYWLKGEKVGNCEVFAILPGPPDNVRTNEKGEFWVALHCRRTMAVHYLSLYPRVRKFLLKLPISARTQFLIHIGGWPHAVVVKCSQDGKILQILEDSEGKVVRSVSEVEEKDGKLWIGSVLMPFVAVYHLN